MITWAEWTQRKYAAAAFSARRSHIAFVLSLVSSLAAVAIISKNHFTYSLWIHVAAFAIPIPIVLYFEKQIVRLRVFTCIAAIVLLLGAAVLFGI